MQGLLEAYDVERADFQRVLDAVDALRSASTDDLRSIDWLVALIRDVGLVPIPEAEQTYEGEQDHLNASQQGLIQLPREFAQWLILAGKHAPASYLEVGCFNGATATLAAAYLQRFNPSFRATTIDLWPAFIFYELVRDRVPLDYVVGSNSFAFRDRKFDVVFIDGDHSFDWAWADYQNVGRGARICALHDVNNAPYREMPLGGVCGAWELIKRQEGGPGVSFLELFEHPSAEIMGIGVRVRA